MCSFLTVIVSFADEPGKQVKSAVGIKNTSKSHVAFKVSTVTVFQPILGSLFSAFSLSSILCFTMNGNLS